MKRAWPYPSAEDEDFIVDDTQPIEEDEDGDTDVECIEEVISELEERMDAVECQLKDILSRVPAGLLCQTDSSPSSKCGQPFKRL